MIHVCTYSHIPLRETPAESGEMGSEILFGELFELLDESGRWAHVRCLNDGYVGWIDIKLLSHLSELEYKRWTTTQPCYVVRGMMCLSRCDDDNSLLVLPCGSRLVLDEQYKDRGRFTIGGHTYTIDFTESKGVASPLINLALSFRNVPYLWGGKTFGGIDCSGLTQVVYHAMGIRLPRNASEQARTGDVVASVDDAKPGDLAFFSSGMVRIDTLTTEGIWNDETKKQTHHLVTIRRPQPLVQHVTEYFQKTMPMATTELVHHSTFELLVAVVLSAQCTDKRVNMVTPALFAAYPDAPAMAKAPVAKIYELIRSVSYPNAKAQHLSDLSQMIVSQYGGKVPSDMEELMRLPGVGRKTANVMLAFAFGADAMPVDTHVFRVARRLGLTYAAHTPYETEQQLTRSIPTDLLSIAHHWLLLHGRYVCTARSPKCSECGLVDICPRFI